MNGHRLVRTLPLAGVLAFLAAMALSTGIALSGPVAQSATGFTPSYAGCPAKNCE
jgi:hypothetical protein